MDSLRTYIRWALINNTIHESARRHASILQEGDDDGESGEDYDITLPEDENVLRERLIEIENDFWEKLKESPPEDQQEIKAIDEFYTEHRDQVIADVDRISQDAATRAPDMGLIASDDDRKMSRRALAELLKKDAESGMSYPYRTAIWLGAYEAGGMTGFEYATGILGAATGALGVAIHAAWPRTFSARGLVKAWKNTDPADVLSTGGRTAIIAASLLAAAWVGQHELAQKAYRALVKSQAEWISAAWKNAIALPALRAVLKNDDEWELLMSAVARGEQDFIATPSRVAGIYNWWKRMQHGVNFGDFARQKNALINTITDLFASNKVLIFEVKAVRGQAGSKIVGRLEVPLNDIIKLDRNELDDFINTIMRRALDSATSTDLKVSENVVSNFGKPGAYKTLMLLEPRANSNLIQLAELLDAGESGCEQYITAVVRNMSLKGDLPPNIKFIPTEAVATASRPTIPRAKNDIIEYIKKSYEAGPIQTKLGELYPGKDLNSLTTQELKTLISSMPEVATDTKILTSPSLSLDLIGAEETLLQNAVKLTRTEVPDMTKALVPAVDSLTFLGKWASGGKRYAIAPISAGLILSPFVTEFGALLAPIFSNKRVETLEFLKVLSDVKIRYQATHAFAAIREMEGDSWTFTDYKNAYGINREQAEMIMDADRFLADLLETQQGSADEALAPERALQISNLYMQGFGFSPLQEGRKIPERSRRLLEALLRELVR